MILSKTALNWFMDGLLDGVKVCDNGGICAWKPYVSPLMRLGYLGIKPACERKSAMQSPYMALLPLHGSTLGHF